MYYIKIRYPYYSVSSLTDRGNISIEEIYNVYVIRRVTASRPNVYVRKCAREKTKQQKTKKKKPKKKPTTTTHTQTNKLTNKQTKWFVLVGENCHGSGFLVLPIHMRGMV